MDGIHYIHILRVVIYLLRSWNIFLANIELKLKLNI